MQCGFLEPARFHIVLLNLQMPTLPPGTEGFSTEAGDACDLTPHLKDVDIIFSNSVIEHVGSRERQTAMADTIRNSRLPYAIQTPNFWFPLEPHAHIPGFQFIPHRLRARMIQRRGFQYFPKKPTYRECLEVSRSTQMLTARQMKRLFPEAVLLKERFFGMAKSFTAVSPALARLPNLPGHPPFFDRIDL